MKLILIAIAALLLASCAGAVPGNPQGYAGINRGTFSYNPETGELSGEVTGGKESERVALSIKTPAGLEVRYSAKGNKVSGQAIRAAVEQAVSEDVRKAAPGIVGRIVAAVMGLGL